MFGDLERSRFIAYSAVCIGLIAIGSWISIPFVPVPFTLQTFFVLVTAAVMKRYAVVPVGLYLLFGAVGLPVFHNGIAGVGVFFGPTGGYLIGFLPAALCAGLAFERESAVLRILGLATATLVIYFFGVFWLVVSTGIPVSSAVILGAVPFLPGDIVKAAAAFLTAKTLGKVS